MIHFLFPMRPHEWLAVLFFCSLLFFIVVSSHALRVFAPITEAAPHYLVDQEIEVYIEGAVERPGVYKLPRGALLKELLSQAKPLPTANLKKFKSESKLRPGQKITVQTVRLKK